jgi:hypothetical protein
MDAARERSAGGIPVQAHPVGWVHLVVHTMHELPQAQLPMQTMQQPVEPSWQPAKPVASVAGVSNPASTMARPNRRIIAAFYTRLSNDP